MFTHATYHCGHHRHITPSHSPSLACMALCMMAWQASGEGGVDGGGGAADELTGHGVHPHQVASRATGAPQIYATHVLHATCAACQLHARITCATAVSSTRAPMCAFPLSLGPFRSVSPCYHFPTLLLPPAYVPALHECAWQKVERLEASLHRVDEPHRNKHLVFAHSDNDATPPSKRQRRSSSPEREATPPPVTKPLNTRLNRYPSNRA
ncbi:unnamed protein product [Closterium sp. NIES-54]